VAYISATFDADMDADSLDAAFTLVDGGGERLTGTVTYAERVAFFWPDALVPAGEQLSAAIGIEALAADGRPLARGHPWTFATATACAPDLGTAGGFAILAGDGVATQPPSAIVGDLGVTGATTAEISGFWLSGDPSAGYATSPQVDGRVYAVDHAAPTPAMLAGAAGDFERAVADVADREPEVVGYAEGDLGGRTLAPGVYQWDGPVAVPIDVTLRGSASDVWILRVGGDLEVGSAARVLLSGPSADQVVWQVGGDVFLGADAHLEGTILGDAATLGTGASVTGRVLVRGAVALDRSVVAAPAP
jgi:hypothetical protein